MLGKCLRLLLPSICVLCRAPTVQPYDLCENCYSQLPLLESNCCVCALPLNTDHTNTCAVCLQNTPPFSGTIVPYRYHPPVNSLIMQLKFQKKLYVARTLGELLSEFLSDYYATRSLPECIIPIPLHRKRLRQRGFNQALEIARPIAKHFSLPLKPYFAKRIKATAAQAELPSAKRRTNVKNAFDHIQFVQKHVAIIDDVITTGATVTALSHSLRRSGVEHIDVWAVARTTL